MMRITISLALTMKSRTKIKQIPGEVRGTGVAKFFMLRVGKKLWWMQLMDCINSSLVNWYECSIHFSLGNLEFLLQTNSHMRWVVSDKEQRNERTKKYAFDLKFIT